MGLDSVMTWNLNIHTRSKTYFTGWLRVISENKKGLLQYQSYSIQIPGKFSLD